MSLLSARELIGQPVISEADRVIGTVETPLVDPKTKSFEGLLIGQADRQGQGFVPLLCLELTVGLVRIIHPPVTPPVSDQRIIGLPAWTTSPKFLVGFVHDCLFDRVTGTIEAFVIHQIVRTWRVPATAVVEITEKSLVIDTDTTIKLKLLPYPSP